MFVSTSPVVEQDTLQDPDKGLALLLEFVNSEWEAFMRSPGKTMRSCMKIPPRFQRFSVDGHVYELGTRKREIWFVRTEDGYNGNRFFVTEAIDERGHMWQLELDRCRDDGYTGDVIVIRTTSLSSGSALNHWGTGRRSPRD